MYLMVAVELTSLGKRHLPRQLWKLIHLLSLPLWVFSTVHLMSAGSEASNPIIGGLVWGMASLVGIMTVYRVASAARGDRRWRSPTPRRMPTASANWSSAASTR